MKKKNKLLFPLSYDECLEDTDDLKIYYQYLDAAFEEPRIHNIAVSGGYGVGKSSVLHSYDKKRQEKRRKEKNFWEKIIIKHDDPRFIYVSIGKYINDADSCGRSTDENKQDEAAEKSAGTEKNIIERRMLLQIYVRFRKKDIAAGQFAMIQEPMRHGRVKAVLGGILILMILLLMFYAPVGNLVKAVVGNDSWIVAMKTKIHILLYAVVIAAGAILGCRLIYYMLTQMRLKNVALKSDSTEIDIEKKACEDYLDLYAMELIRCLEQIADQVDRTVVFEDMDRLNQKDCIEIFSRLREINFMVNQRMPKGKHIRFVYVIKDEVLSAMQHAKFFDYIMPVIPGVNEKSSEDIFREGLKEVNENLRKRYDTPEVKRTTIQSEKQERIRLVHLAAPHIRDYRMQYTILNDYSLFFELYYVNNKNDIKPDTAEKILALAVYKNIWPRQYDRVTSGVTTELFDSYTLTNDKFAESLVDFPNIFLSYESLCYLGYSRRKLIDNVKNYIENAETAEAKATIIGRFPAGDIYVEALREFAKEEIPPTVDKENFKETGRILSRTIRLFARSNADHMGDLLKKRDLHLCLYALGLMSDEEWKEYIDKVKGQEYFLLDEESGDKFDIFKKCLNVKFDDPEYNWTEKEIKIFIYGTNEAEKYEGIYIPTKDFNLNSNIIDLEESIRQREIRYFHKNT